MNQFACEICGSEIIREGAAFVCSGCGMKYDAEALRAMMNPAAGDKYDKILVLARRARSENDLDGALKYYEQALMEQPGNWECRFYTAYYKLAVQQLSDDLTPFENFGRSALFVLQSIQAECPEDQWQAALAECTTAISDFYCGLGGPGGVLERLHKDLTQRQSQFMMNCAPSQFESGMARMNAERWALHDSCRSFRANLMEIRSAAANHPARPAGKASIDGLNRAMDVLFQMDANHYTQYLNIKCADFMEEIFAFEDLRLTEDPAYACPAAAIIRQKAEQDKFHSEVYKIAGDCLKKRDAAHQARRAEAYWAEHPAELQKLKGRQQALRCQIEDAEAEEALLTNSAEEKAAESRILELNTRKDGLGMFKIKEKKALQAEIDAAEADLQKLRERNRSAAKKLRNDIFGMKDEIRDIDRQIARG